MRIKELMVHIRRNTPKNIWEVYKNSNKRHSFTTGTQYEAIDLARELFRGTNTKGTVFIHNTEGDVRRSYNYNTTPHNTLVS